MPSTSRSLLQRARQKDAAAWDQLVDLYSPLVWAWVTESGLKSQDAEDVFQEAFQAAAASLHQFRKDSRHGSFRGWLRTIVRSKTMDHYRRRRHQPLGEGGSEAQAGWQELAAPAEPSEGPGDRSEPILRAQLRRVLDRLRPGFSESTWQAFERTVLDGRAPVDVAADLGLSPGAVRVAKCRVLQRLRAELGDVAE